MLNFQIKSGGSQPRARGAACSRRSWNIWKRSVCLSVGERERAGSERAEGGEGVRGWDCALFLCRNSSLPTQRAQNGFEEEEQQRLTIFLSLFFFLLPPFLTLVVGGF